MKRHILQTLTLFALVAVISSCGQSLEKKLTGTWKVADVQTDFDETQVTPEMLSQVVDMQKQTFFRIMSDSLLVIVSHKNTYEASWVIDEETNNITYFFKGSGTKGNELGKFTEGQIVSHTKTPIGSMTIYYEKEDEK